ncbi:MAG TPA: hypothetical protein VGQ36_18870 [Thermoanaerobaculia bacterium]|jgi:hypothetical protein|nr:hypothetical protein [Thermoanaerobaculia bacterium]
MDIDSTIREMYASMSFETGAHPDWERQAALFAPDARLVRVNDGGVFEFDLRTFRGDFETMISSGVLSSFWEHELWRETRVFGDFAHVLSIYEMRSSRAGDVVARAVKSIQLFRRGDRWLISAMLWRREGQNVRIQMPFAE